MPTSGTLGAGLVMALGFAALATVTVPAPVTAAPTISATATFGQGEHPKRQTLWLRAVDLPTGGVITIVYLRTDGPPDQGKISGKCEVPGREGMIAIRQLRVRDRRAARGYLFPPPLADGDLLECRLRFKKAPALGEGNRAELTVELAAPEIFPP